MLPVGQPAPQELEDAVWPSDIRVWRLKLAGAGPSPVVAVPAVGATCCCGRDHRIPPAVVWMPGQGEGKADYRMLCWE